MIEPRQITVGESAQLSAYAVLNPAYHRALRLRCLLWGSAAVTPNKFVGLQPRYYDEGINWPLPKRIA